MRLGMMTNKVGSSSKNYHLGTRVFIRFPHKKPTPGVLNNLVQTAKPGASSVKTAPLASSCPSVPSTFSNNKGGGGIISNLKGRFAIFGINPPPRPKVIPNFSFARAATFINTSTTTSNQFPYQSPITLPPISVPQTIDLVKKLDSNFSSLSLRENRNELLGDRKENPYNLSWKPLFKLTLQELEVFSQFLEKYHLIDLSHTTGLIKTVQDLASNIKFYGAALTGETTRHIVALVPMTQHSNGDLEGLGTVLTSAPFQHLHKVGKVLNLLLGRERVMADLQKERQHMLIPATIRMAYGYQPIPKFLLEELPIIRVIAVLTRYNLLNFSITPGTNVKACIQALTNEYNKVILDQNEIKRKAYNHLVVTLFELAKKACFGGGNTNGSGDI